MELAITHDCVRAADSAPERSAFGEGSVHFRGRMYEAPESRAREARGAHCDVGRTHLWWWQRLEGQQESWLGQQGFQEPRGQEPRGQEPRGPEPQERLGEVYCVRPQGPPGNRAPRGVSRR